MKKTPEKFRCYVIGMPEEYEQFVWDTGEMGEDDTLALEVLSKRAYDYEIAVEHYAVLSQGNDVLADKLINGTPEKPVVHVLVYDDGSEELGSPNYGYDFEPTRTLLPEESREQIESFLGTLMRARIASEIKKHLEAYLREVKKHNLN